MKTPPLAPCLNAARRLPAIAESPCRFGLLPGRSQALVPTTGSTPRANAVGAGGSRLKRWGRPAVIGLLSTLSLACVLAAPARVVSVSTVDSSYLLVHVEEGAVSFADNASGPSAYRNFVDDPSLNVVVPYGTLPVDQATNPANWTIRGPGAYSGGLQPEAIHRKTKVNGMAQLAWNDAAADFNYAYTLEHQIYLRLPQPLAQGSPITLEIAPAVNVNLASTNLVFDVFQARSEAIKVNLVGYDTTNAVHAADLYLWMGDGGARDYASFVGRKVYLYHVLTGTAQEVGSVALWKPAGPDLFGRDMTRSSVWAADFATPATPGTYRLAVEGVGCSQDFEVKSGVYRDPFLVSTRGFFYMRIGQDSLDMVPVPRRPLFRSSPAKDPANFRVLKTDMHPYRAEWAGGGDRWDEPQFFAAFVQPGRPENPAAAGGHSDALDWDRHLGHISIIHDLLLPFLLSGGRLEDDDLGLAESGNGIPDVIDEARYEVDFWLSLRDGSGYAHGLSNPDNDNIMYQAGATAIAAWAAAANAAMLAESFRLARRPQEMNFYRNAALQAYRHADSLSDPMLDRTQEAGGATFRGRDLKMTAAAFLFNLTGDRAWEAVLRAESIATSPTAVLARFDAHNQDYASVAYLTTPWPVGDPDLREPMRAAFVHRGQQLAAQRHNRPSRRGTEEELGYFHTIQNMQAAIVAHAMTDDRNIAQDLLTALTLEADWGLGRNPLNMIQMTTATTALASERSVTALYSSGPNDGTPGQHPGHTPYMNMDDWFSGMVMGRPSALSSRGYPPAANWPAGELFFNTRYVWAHSEFTPQQTMRGKQALYGYLYAITKTAGPVTYPVSYFANGAERGSTPANQIKTHDVALELMASDSGQLEWTGYVLDAWNTAPDGTGIDYAPGASYLGNAPLALHAKWRAVPTYSVTYHANGATEGSAPASQTKTHDVPLILASNDGQLVRPGHGFAGWNTVPDGSGIDYAAGAPYTANAAVTLHARWILDVTAPSPPSALQVLWASTNRIELAWSPSTDLYGLNGYRVFRDGFLAGTSFTTTFIDTGLLPDRHYVYTVRAVDLAGNVSPESAPVVGTTAAWDPNEYLDIFTDTASMIQDTWPGGGTLVIAQVEPHEGRQHYRYAYDLANWWDGFGLNLINWSGNGTGKNFAAYDAIQLAYKLTGDVAANLVLVDADNTSRTVPVPLGIATPIYQVVTIPLTAFTGIPLDDIGEIDVHLNGFGPAGQGVLDLDNIRLVRMASYPVTYHANAATGGTPPANQSKAHGLNLILAGNPGNLSRAGYYFSGWNTTADGSGTAFAEGSQYTENAALALYAVWLADNTPPSAPQDLTATGVTSTQINLSWSPSTDDHGVSGYQIFRDGVLAGTSAGTLFADTGLAPDARPTYTVVAVDVAGNVSPTSVAVVGVTAGQDPNQYLDVFTDAASLILATWTNGVTMALSQAQPYEGREHYRFSYDFSSWWAGFGLNLNNWMGNGLGRNFAAYDAIQIAYRLTGPASVTVAFKDADNATRTEPVLLGNPTGTYQWITLPLSAFTGMPIDDVGEIDVNIGGTQPSGQGLLDLDAIRLVKFATYAITYHANGATAGGVPLSQTKTNGYPLILAANSGNLSKDGRAFVGWNSASDSNGVGYAPGATFTDNAPMILYAMFDSLLAAHGTPIDWLRFYGLTSPSFDAAELADADGDGLAAWQEWVAGTDPTRAASVLRIQGIERFADGRGELRWPSAAGRLYRVQVSDSAESGYETLADGLPATAPTNVFTTAPTSQLRRFFRLVVVKP